MPPRRHHADGCDRRHREHRNAGGNQGPGDPAATGTRAPPDTAEIGVETPHIDGVGRSRRHGADLVLVARALFGQPGKDPVYVRLVPGRLLAQQVTDPCRLGLARRWFRERPGPVLPITHANPP